MATLKHLAKEIFGLNLSRAQLQAFEHYTLELSAWKQHTNLTSIIEPQDILIKHFLDSLSCLLAIKPRSNTKQALRVIDVGSGAGFPGLPLAIVERDIHMTVLEATEKKCTFMRQIVTDLKLKNTRVIHSRAETLGRDPEHRDHYDWSIARAVAHLPVLLEYMLPLTRKGGHCLTQKAGTARAEIQDAAHALDVLGGQVENMHQVCLPGISEPRYVIVIKKVATTPEMYPRRTGAPVKRPLL